MDIQQAQYYMSLALKESKQALPNCLPNPPVGCVIVDDRNNVTKSHTLSPGQYHAEAAALAKLSPNSSPLFVFVTLEPCSFHGRTPSCAEALIEKQVNTVFVAITDPDPRNNGRGISLLRQSGINVVEGVFADEVQEFLQPYLNRS